MKHINYRREAQKEIILDKINESYLTKCDYYSLKKISEELGIHYNTIRIYAKILLKEKKLQKKNKRYLPADNFIFHNRNIPYKEIYKLYKKEKSNNDILTALPVIDDERLFLYFIMVIGEMISRGLYMEDLKCFIAEQK